MADLVSTPSNEFTSDLLAFSIGNNQLQGENSYNQYAIIITVYPPNLVPHDPGAGGLIRDTSEMANNAYSRSSWFRSVVADTFTEADEARPYRVIHELGNRRWVFYWPDREEWEREQVPGVKRK